MELGKKGSNLGKKEKKNEGDCLSKTQNFANRIYGSIRFEVCSMPKNNLKGESRKRIYR